MHTVPRRSLSLIALLFSLATGSAAGADAPLVLAFDELPPWKVQMGGRFGGAYTEIVRELARRVDLPLRIVNCPLKRCLFMLEEGSADIAIGFKDTHERRRYLHFLATPYRQRSADKVFYVRKDKGVRITRYDDLAGLRVGVKLGASYFKRFDEDTTLNKAQARDMEANFRKLAYDRLDAVLIPEDQGEAMLARLGLGKLLVKAAWRHADPTPRSISVGKKSRHAHRIAAFEKAMAAIARDGTLEKLYRRHYFDDLHVAYDAVAIQ